MMKSKRNIGARANVPSWLADPDRVAPCLCGMPLLPGQMHIVAEGELGMKRWFHSGCWETLMDMDDDDDWDDDDGED